MAHGDFKDLSKRTASDKAFNIAENPKYGCHYGLASVVYKFFDKKSQLLADKSASGGAIKNKIMPNKELTELLEN